MVVVDVGRLGTFDPSTEAPIHNQKQMMLLLQLLLSL